MGTGTEDTQPPWGCSPAASAHSTIWGSGKWRRNPALPGSPETLQGTIMSVTRCVPDPRCRPACLHPLTGQVAPCLPHAPHRGVLRLLPARRSQERVVLQLGEALGAADKRADTCCHPRGARVPCQIPTAGGRGCQDQWLVPTPQSVTTGKSFCPAVTNVTNAPHHGPGPLPAWDHRALPGERRCPAQGSVRLSYQGQQ